MRRARPSPRGDPADAVTSRVISFAARFRYGCLVMENASAQANRPRVAVIGAGPAGLMAAETIVQSGAGEVTLFERMASPARKLLLAGRGGLNLTHGEPLPTFLGRYGTATDHLRPAIEAFGPEQLRHWCAGLGIDTFVGSSGRVFPASFKTSPLLRAWLRRLDTTGVRLAVRHAWRGWNEDGGLRFETPLGEVTVDADAVVLALGGASWPQLGSDGSWVTPIAAAGLAITPFQPANCGFAVAWSDGFRDRFEGEALKNVALSFEGRSARGDLVVTRAGLEGGPLYQLGPALRAAVARDGTALVRLALRPNQSHAALVARLGKRQPKQSFSTALRKTLALPPVAISLLRGPTTADEGRIAADSADGLARLVNAVSLRLDAAMPLARAISTAGGVAFDEVDGDLMLRRRPGTFVAGEMLDWEAPTGGYLLQACLATGAAAGRGVVAWLEGRTQVDAWRVASE